MKKLILLAALITVTFTPFVYAAQSSEQSPSQADLEIALVNDVNCDGDNAWTDYCLEGAAVLEAQDRIMGQSN